MSVVVVSNPTDINEALVDNKPAGASLMYSHSGSPKDQQGYPGLPAPAWTAQDIEGTITTDGDQLRINYQEGFRGGQSPGILYKVGYRSPIQANQMYFSAFVTANLTDSHPIQNKLVYINNRNAADTGADFELIVGFYETTRDYAADPDVTLPDNMGWRFWWGAQGSGVGGVTGNPIPSEEEAETTEPGAFSFYYGERVFLEVLLQMSSGNNIYDGWIKIFANGVLQHHTTGWCFGNKTYLDYLKIDGVRGGQSYDVGAVSGIDENHILLQDVNMWGVE